MVPRSLSNLKRLMRGTFGLSEFRPGQQEVVRAMVDGRDAVAIMPTGAGKSLCYQLPALHLPGTTIVVSPLIALMKDQADTLRERFTASHDEFADGKEQQVTEDERDDAPPGDEERCKRRAMQPSCRKHREQQRRRTGGDEGEHAQQAGGLMRVAAVANPAEIHLTRKDGRQRGGNRGDDGVRRDPCWKEREPERRIAPGKYRR